MGQFRIEVADKAKIDFEKIYKSGNKVTIKKLEKIMLELSFDHLSLRGGTTKQSRFLTLAKFFY